MGRLKSFDKQRSSRIAVGAGLAAIALAVVAFFGPWIWALVEIESDKHDEQQATENFVAEMQKRSSLESVDARSKLLIGRMATVITELAPTVDFPNGPSSGLGSCPRYLTDGKRLDGRSQTATRKIPNDVWNRVRDRVVAEAQSLEITRIEVDNSTPSAQVLKLSDVDGDFKLTISNTNPQARAIISIDTDCHLPESDLKTSIRPTS